MGLEITKAEVAEAAGHLRAELLSARDRLRVGELSEADYRKRVKIIARSAARFHQAATPRPGTLLLIMEDIH